LGNFRSEGPSDFMHGPKINKKEKMQKTIKKINLIIIIILSVMLLKEVELVQTTFDFIMVTKNGFQDPATTLMEAIIDLYTYVMYFLYIIVFILIAFFSDILLN
jgi:hypothetical protein